MQVLFRPIHGITPSADWAGVVTLHIPTPLPYIAYRLPDISLPSITIPALVPRLFRLARKPTEFTQIVGMAGEITPYPYCNAKNNLSEKLFLLLLVL